MHSRDWNLTIARVVYGLSNYVRESVLDVDEEGYLVIKLSNGQIRVKDLMDRNNLDIAYIRVLPAIKKSMDMVYESYKAIAEALGYEKSLVPVYPMKVNPTPIVVETIAKYGEKYKWGFNAGSVGEVKLLQKIAEEYSPRTLIYDGVITESIAQELLKFSSRGWRVIVDVDSEAETEVVAKYPGLEVGLRIKPLVKLHGKWSGSVGLASKFGLTLNTLSKLKEEFKWLVDRVVMLHMHPGSQVYRLEDVEKYFNEVKHVYEELGYMGFENITLVDPGGGMAYPYLDSRDGSEEAPDYTIVDYFRALLDKFARVSKRPDLVFEGGRFITAAHRVVVAKVVEVKPYSAVHSQREQQEELKDVKNIEEIKELLSRLRVMLENLRTNGPLTNSKRALYEDLVATIREDLPAKVAELLVEGKVDVSELLSEQRILRILLTPTKRVVLNMSIFADLPDAVLVDQYFQAVPVHRLCEQPSVLATFSDLTCDSMGELNLFISQGAKVKGGSPIFTKFDNRLIMLPGVKLRLRGVPLHLPERGENYYVAFLDTGAYQDTLAMKHNLIYGAPEIIVDEENGKVKVEFLRHEEYYS